MPSLASPFSMMRASAAPSSPCPVHNRGRRASRAWSPSRNSAPASSMTHSCPYRILPGSTHLPRTLLSDHPLRLDFDDAALFFQLAYRSSSNFTIELTHATDGCSYAAFNRFYPELDKNRSTPPTAGASRKVLNGLMVMASREPNTSNLRRCKQLKKVSRYLGNRAVWVSCFTVAIAQSRNDVALWESRVGGAG